VPLARASDKGGMIAPAARLLARSWSMALDFALPPRCPGCGAIVDGDGRFCAGCWQALDFLGPPACARCGIPLPYAIGPEALCGGCHARSPAFDSAAAAVAYGDIARAAVLRLKYGGRPGMARMMARQMARHTARLPAHAILAAVPLHRRRLWSRGYNQALLIARALGKASGHPVSPDLLVRTRATPVLRGLGRKARAKAVAGAFAVPARHRPALKGRAVILIDDVFTSGATAEACARALKRAGAASVHLLCWARVLREEDAIGR